MPSIEEIMSVIKNKPLGRVLEISRINNQSEKLIAEQKTSRIGIKRIKRSCKEKHANIFA